MVRVRCPLICRGSSSQEAHGLDQEFATKAAMSSIVKMLLATSQTASFLHVPTVAKMLASSGDIDIFCAQGVVGRENSEDGCRGAADRQTGSSQSGYGSSRSNVRKLKGTNNIEHNSNQFGRKFCMSPFLATPRACRSP